MQWRGLFAGDHRAWLIHLRLAQQRSGVGYARLLQFIFKNGTGIARAILNGEGQREGIGPLGQAAGERIAIGTTSSSQYCASGEPFASVRTWLNIVTG